MSEELCDLFLSERSFCRLFFLFQSLGKCANLTNRNLYLDVFVFLFDSKEIYEKYINNTALDDELIRELNELIDAYNNQEPNTNIVNKNKTNLNIRQF